MRRKQIALGCFARVALLVLTLCVLPSKFVAAQTTVVGYSSVTSVFLPFWIGTEMGFYQKEGLDVQLVYIPSSTTMAQSMFAREVAISTANASSVVSSGLQGGDLVLLGAVINTTTFYIIARPEIASVQDLKGKRVGVTRLGSSSDFAVHEYLQKNKLQAGRDVTVIQSGGMPELAAALSSGAISAAPLSSPMSYVAEQRGNRVLANLANEGIYFVIAGLTTSRRYLKENRRDAKAFLRGFGRATHAMFQQRDAAKTVLAKYTKVEDPGMLEGSLKYAQDFTEKIPLVKREGVQVVLEQEAAKNPKARQFAAEQFYDNALVQELINEGFYRSLWSK